MVRISTLNFEKIWNFPNKNQKNVGDFFVMYAKNHNFAIRNNQLNFWIMAKSIKFYEWSDLNRQPLLFFNDLDFLDFCKRSSIPVTNGVKNSLTKYDNTYAVCANGKPNLLISNTPQNLRRNYRRELKRNVNESR